MCNAAACKQCRRELVLSGPHLLGLRELCVQMVVCDHVDVYRRVTSCLGVVVIVVDPRRGDILSWCCGQVVVDPKCFQFVLLLFTGKAKASFTYGLVWAEAQGPQD